MYAKNWWLNPVQEKKSCRQRDSIQTDKSGTVLSAHTTVASHPDQPREWIATKLQVAKASYLAPEKG